MAASYDLVVIGTGVAASVAATQCRAAGWSVAIVDYRPFGGTCALRGCDPKKVLVGAADAVERPRRLRDKGVRERDSGIDWPELMAFKRGFTDPVPSMKEESYVQKGIDTFHGRARFTGRTTVAVEGEALEGRRVLIAAGAEPMTLGIAGEEHLTTSDEFLELNELPKRIVFVGGGFIGFELAHVARRAGAEVTVLERAPTVLGPFDQDLVGWLVERSRDLGIDVRAGTAVEAVEQEAGGFTVRSVAASHGETFQADLVVHSAGRVPALERLDLEVAGIEHDKGRPTLNEFLQSASNPAV
ncbi:MAG: NAD(P)/FAD-dependent oxidoreductase, partial [Halofilum sp. (in: g-proteobacteria)]